MFCKKCGNELNAQDKVCSKCGEGVKKPVVRKWWFWVLMGLATIVTVVALGSTDSEEIDDVGTTVSNTSQLVQSEDKKDEEKIQYEKVDLQKMLDDLDANALNAERTYQDKYVEVSGRIVNFDSDGSYISIEPENADAWNFDHVMCDIKNDKQLEFLLKKQKGDVVTIKGQISSIGEVLGYTIKIAEVY